MNNLLSVVLTTALAAGGMGFTGLSMAEDKDPHGGYHHADKKDGHHGEYHNCSYKNIPWMKGMSEEQGKKIAKLHDEYKTKKGELKKKIYAAKMELRKAIATDKPDQNAINANIDAILKIKKEKMQLKVQKKINIRKLLNKEQQALFDDYLVNKEKYCNHGKGHHS